MKVPRFIAIAAGLVIFIAFYDGWYPYRIRLPDGGIFIFSAIAWAWVKGSNAARWALGYYVAAFFMISFGLPSGATSGVPGRRPQPSVYEVAFDLGIVLLVFGTIQGVRVLRTTVASRRASPKPIVDGRATPERVDDSRGRRAGP